MSRVLAAVFACAVCLPSPLTAGPVIKTMCQKNLDDGRILIQDEKVLPFDDSTFKVLTYRATSSDSGWSEGPCTISVTGRAG